MSAITPSVDRSLFDQAMDNIDHALGRPLDPLADTYRNCFATDDQALADAFMASPHWVKTASNGAMSYFGVTKAGRLALASYLKDVGSKHRLYRIWLNGVEMSPVVATSPAKARYMKFLDFDDDRTFGEFCRCTRVRLEQGPTP